MNLPIESTRDRAESAQASDIADLSTRTYSTVESVQAEPEQNSMGMYDVVKLSGSEESMNENILPDVVQITEITADCLFKTTNIPNVSEMGEDLQPSTHELQQDSSINVENEQTKQLYSRLNYPHQKQSRDNDHQGKTVPDQQLRRDKPESAHHQQLDSAECPTDDLNTTSTKTTAALSYPGDSPTATPNTRTTTVIGQTLPDIPPIQTLYQCPQPSYSGDNPTATPSTSCTTTTTVLGQNLPDIPPIQTLYEYDEVDISLLKERPSGDVKEGQLSEPEYDDPNCLILPGAQTLEPATPTKQEAEYDEPEVNVAHLKGSKQLDTHDSGLDCQQASTGTKDFSSHEYATLESERRELLNSTQGYSKLQWEDTVENSKPNEAKQHEDSLP